MPREKLIDLTKTFVPTTVLLALLGPMLWQLNAAASDTNAKVATMAHHLQMLDARAAAREIAWQTWVESFRVAHPELRVPVYQVPR